MIDLSERLKGLPPGPWKVVKGPKIMLVILDARNNDVARTHDDTHLADAIAALPEAAARIRDLEEALFTMDDTIALKRADKAEAELARLRAENAELRRLIEEVIARGHLMADDFLKARVMLAKAANETDADLPTAADVRGILKEELGGEMTTQAEIEAAILAAKEWLPTDTPDINVRHTVGAALEAAACARWQPIDTAPKDGTPIFGYWPLSDGPAFDVIWWDEHLQWTDGDFHFHKPTHWQPLPEAPK
jgi:Protein of unknown function (DUF551)